MVFHFSQKIESDDDDDDEEETDSEDDDEDDDEEEEDEEEETTNEGAQPCERRGNAERRRPRLPVLPGPFDPGSPLRSPGSTSDSRLSFFRLAASSPLLPSRAFFSALFEAPSTLLSRLRYDASSRACARPAATGD